MRAEQAGAAGLGEAVVTPEIGEAWSEAVLALADILDTGVRASHVDFTGRAEAGYSAGCPTGHDLGDGPLTTTTAATRRPPARRAKRRRPYLFRYMPLHLFMRFMLLCCLCCFWLRQHGARRVAGPRRQPAEERDRDLLLLERRRCAAGGGSRPQHMIGGRRVIAGKLYVH